MGQLYILFLGEYKNEKDFLSTLIASSLLGCNHDSVNIPNNVIVPGVPEFLSCLSYHCRLR
uniref:hypothetical protein n=1 Tax=Vibrio cholerae TaxID=666 RepID=UPI003F58FB18